MWSRCNPYNVKECQRISVKQKGGDLMGTPWCEARPCFLPPSCYCAALSSLLQSTAESDLLHSLLSLSKPDRIARRAPGISSGDTGPCDITAREILRQSLVGGSVIFSKLPSLVITGKHGAKWCQLIIFLGDGLKRVKTSTQVRSGRRPTSTLQRPGANLEIQRLWYWRWTNGHLSSALLVQS